MSAVRTPQDLSFPPEECSSGASITRMPQCMSNSNVATTFIDVAEEELVDNATTRILKGHSRECKQSRLLLNNFCHVL